MIETIGPAAASYFARLAALARHGEAHERAREMLALARELKIDALVPVAF